MEAPAGPLLGEILANLGEPEFGAEHLEKGFRVGLVMDREPGINADPRALGTGEPGTPSRETCHPRPWFGRQRCCCPFGIVGRGPLVAVRATRWSKDSAERRGEGQQQNPVWRDPVQEQASGPMREKRGSYPSPAGDDSNKGERPCSTTLRWESFYTTGGDLRP